MPVIAIQNLSLANTVGEWVNVTNDLVNTFNGIVYGDFYKPAGTMYLLEPTTGLVVSNTAVFSGQVEIASPYGSLLVRTNADIQGELTLSNTNGIDLVLSANGTANINYLNIVGTGLAANVANNMYIGGTLTVSGNTTMSSNLTVANSITANSGTITRDLDINRHANVNNNLVVGGNIEGDSILTIYGDTYLKTSLAVTGTTYTDILQANTSANTETLNVTDVTKTKSLAVTNKTSTDTLQANTSANTRTLSVTGTTYTNSLVANTSTTTITANVSSLLDANSADAFFGTVQTQGKLSVGGDFVINGSTVYNSNTLTLSAASTNQISYVNVYRSPGANASIRWYEPGKYWDILDVTTGGVYSKILTANLISDSVTSIIASNVASSFAANTLNNSIISVNTALIANVASLQGQITSNVNSLQAQISANAVSSNAVISTANTNMKSYVDANVILLQSQISANAVSSNAVIVTANTNMKNYVDSTFIKFVPSGSVQTISSDLTVTGNLIISGTSSVINTNILQVNDSLIKLANNNTTGDALDIGFYGEYNTGGNLRYTGLFRKAADHFYLVKDVIPDPTSNTFIFSTSNRAILDASLTGGTVSGLSGAIAIVDGGTNATSVAGALNNLMPSGAVNQYVLTTGGQGSYYWAAAPGASTNYQGTSINSTRTFATATAGQTVFTTPTFSISTQVRLYINGVRQYDSDYSVTVPNTITLSPGCTLGDSVMIEVDAYNTYTQLASLTSYANTGTITSITVQGALDYIESDKMRKSGGTFTGQVVYPAGSTSVAPIRLTSGTNLTSPISGAVEFDGTNLYLTNSSVARKTVAYIDGTVATATNVAYSGLTGTVPTWNQSTTGNALTSTTADHITNATYNGYGVRTVSTAAPSGGSNGDIWYKY